MPSSKMQEWDEFYKVGKTAVIPDLFMVRRFAAEASMGRRVLILAAGAGRNAIWLAKRGFYVMATDLSEEATEKLKWWARVEGVHDHIDAVPMDLLDGKTVSYGFLGQHTYDFIIFEGCLEYVDDEKALEVLKRAGACMKPGARVFVIARGPSHWAHGSTERSDGFMKTYARGEIGFIKLMSDALSLKEFNISKEEWLTSKFTGGQLLWSEAVSQDYYIEGWR